MYMKYEYPIRDKDTQSGETSGTIWDTPGCVMEHDGLVGLVQTQIVVEVDPEGVSE